MKSYNKLSKDTIIDEIESNITEVTSSKVFAVQKNNDLLTNIEKNIKYTITNSADWARNIVLNFENSANSNIYKQIKATNIPPNDSETSTDRSVIYEIIYNTGNTDRPIYYQIKQKRQLINICITNCKYEWIELNTYTLLILTLNNNNNFSKGYKIKNNEIKYDEVVTFNEALQLLLTNFSNDNNNNLTFNFYNSPILLNVLNDITPKLTYNENINFISSVPIVFDNINYNIYFLFNNISNIYKNFSYINFTFHKNELYNNNLSNDLISKNNNVYYMNLNILKDDLSLINNNITKNYFDILKLLLSEQLSNDPDLIRPELIEDKIIIKCDIDIILNNLFGCNTSIEFYVNFDNDGNLKIVLDNNKFILNNDDNNTLYNYLNNQDLNNLTISIPTINEWDTFISYSNNQLFNIGDYIIANPI